MNKFINIFTNQNELSREVRNELRTKLAKKSYTTSSYYETNAELNIVIGGDGSFLRAVHDSNFSPIPFVGINTGSLGYFQEINKDEIDSFLTAYERGDYEMEELLLLEAKIKSDSGNYSQFALNEFSFKSKLTSIIHLDLFVDDFHFETIAGDGLILSTPSGSTAYNLSAGGAILYQQLRGYQLMPLAPINSKRFRTLISPLVVSEKTKVKIKIRETEREHIALACDGIQKYFGSIEEIEFFIPNSVIKKLVFKPTWYWQNIKEKLL